MIQELLNKRMEIFDIYLNKTNLSHQQYQKDGVRWILNNELREDPVCGIRGGFIADEMGLGKTIMMIGAMLCNSSTASLTTFGKGSAELRAKDCDKGSDCCAAELVFNRTLIIVPPALVSQWYVQIARTTGHKSLIYHGNHKKIMCSADLENAKIVITTYGTISVSAKKKVMSPLHTIYWPRVIFDEAHHLRNRNTSIYFGAKLLKSSICWLVSGTPIQNCKKDFYNLCSMIGLPSSYYTDYDNLKELTRAFIMKRTKKQVGIILPQIIEDKNIVSWSNDREKELSEELHSMLEFSRVQGKSFGGHLSAIIKARQSCILPRLLSNKRGGYAAEYMEAFDCSSKLDFVVGKILERKGNGNGKLIFCHFREEIDEIALRLNKGGIASVATFDGRTSEVQRREILGQSNEALILQIQTGCEGLNLQEHYSEIYFISPHWNPAIEDQAVARCHRIGQTKVVYVERFEMCGFLPPFPKVDMNIEEYVYFKQGIKREIAFSLLPN
jgi:SNF2 family DNA or RNA helicase